MLRPLDEYLKDLEQSLSRHFAPGQVYHGKLGAERLARELGYGLFSYPDKEVDNVLGNLYSTMLVRFTFNSYGVPLDNKEFIKIIKEGMSSKRRL